MSKGRNLAKLAVSNTGGIQVSALSTVVGAAPAALDTFNELAAALNNDANFATSVNNSLAAKQATLVSGTNIKTINSTSLLGSGNIAVQPTLVSGTNIKTINGNSLLYNGDLSLQPTLISGSNIKTINGTSLLGSGDIAISGGGGSSLTGLTQTTIVSGSSPYGNTILGTGSYATANNQNTRYNVVVGVNSYANWYDSVVLGYNTKGEGAQTITIGTSARNQGEYSVSIGTNSGVGSSSGQSVVVGTSASVSDYTGSSTVLGYYAKSYASQAVAVGHYAEARGSSSIAIGKSAYAQGADSIVIGQSNHAYGSSSIIIGNNNDDGYNSAIVLNATSNPMSAGGSGFYVNPIQSGTTSNVLYYDNVSKQITYGAASSGGGGGGQLSTLSDVSISNPTPGQVLTFQNGLWRNVTPAASSGGGGGTPTLRQNGFAISNANPFDGVIDFTSSGERDSFMSALTLIVNKCDSFAVNTGIVMSVVAETAVNGDWIMFPPEWSPTVAKPTISLFGPSSAQVSLPNGSAQNMPLSNSPQYTDNNGRAWYQVNCNPLQYMNISFNPQWGGQSLAKIWPNQYNAPGSDPLMSLITLINEFTTIDTGSHSNVFRASGYNAATGQNTTCIFIGCTNIQLNGSEVSFNYTSLTDTGMMWGSSSLMWALDIQ